MSKEIINKLQNEIEEKGLNKLTNTKSQLGKIAQSITNVYDTMFSKSYFWDMLKGGVSPFDAFEKDEIEFGNKIRHLAEGHLISGERQEGFVPTRKAIKQRYQTKTEGRIERQVQNTYSVLENKKYFQNGEGYAQFIAGQDKKVRDAHYFEKLNAFKYIFGATTTEFLTPEVIAFIEPVKTFVNNHVVNLGNKTTLDMITTIREKVRLIESAESDKWNIGSKTDGADIATGVPPLMNSWDIKTNGILIMSIKDSESIKKLSSDIFHPEYFLNFKEMFAQVIELDIPSGSMYLLSKECMGMYKYYTGQFTTFYPNNLQNVLDFHYDFTFTTVPFANGLKFTWTNTKATKADVETKSKKSKAKDEVEVEVNEIVEGEGN
ncbi:MAG: hypothetical protein ACRCUM_02325 [Mycoplasmoidaceae bacterium]